MQVPAYPAAGTQRPAVAVKEDSNKNQVDEIIERTRRTIDDKFGDKWEQVQGQQQTFQRTVAERLEEQRRAHQRSVEQQQRDMEQQLQELKTATVKLEQRAMQPMLAPQQQSQPQPMIVFAQQPPAQAPVFQAQAAPTKQMAQNEKLASFSKQMADVWAEMQSK